MKDQRKVQGAQWYITLPREWRNKDGHDVKKGDTLDAYYNPDSVLIFNPDSREMSSLEERLVNLLINLPSYVDTNELVDELKKVVEQIEA